MTGETEPLVSVVCPTRNGGAHLRASIESVLTQSYDAIELIVIDGQSDDDSVDILEEYGDLLEYVSEPDDGQSDAINKGFARASGDILGWLNSDDELLPNAITRVVEAFRRTGADLVYGDAIAEDGRGRRYGLRTNVAPGSFETLRDDRCFIVQPASYWTRELWEAAGPLRTDLHFALDYDFFLRAIRTHDFAYVPHTLAVERIHAAAKTYVGHRERMVEFERTAREHGAADLPAGFRSEGAAIMLVEAMKCAIGGDRSSARDEFEKARGWIDDPIRTGLFFATIAPGHGRHLARGRLVNNLLASSSRRLRDGARTDDVRTYRLQRTGSTPLSARLAAVQRRTRSTRFRPLQRAAEQMMPSLGVLDQYPPRPLDLGESHSATISNPPSITIVTPSFNQAAFLPATIESVLTQNYPSLEYIVQDGASTDGSVEVLRRYDDVLSRWESTPDGGQANAINTGHGSGSGEVMGWLNSDDILLPGYLATVGQYLAANPDVDVVYSHRVIIDREGFEIGRWMLPRHDPNALLWADYVPQETLFWRRKIWEEVGGLDESFRFAMDWDLLLRFQAAGAKIVRLPYFGGGFRVYDEQLTSAAIDTIGSSEMARLRRRCHGRNVDQAEIMKALVPFMARHVVLRTAWQLGVVKT